MRVVFAFLIFIISFGSKAEYLDEVIFVKRSDTAMNAAFKNARETVDDFLEIAAQRPEEYSGFSAYIKVVDGEAVEYLWVADVQPYKEDKYIGVVISKPGLVSNVSYGATVGYTKSDIYDWQYYNNKTKKTVGSFTTCVLLKPGNPEDEKYKKEVGLDCNT